MSTKGTTKDIAQAASALQECRPFQNVISQNQTSAASCPSTSGAERFGNLVKDCQCANTVSHSNACNSQNTNRCFLQRMENSHQLRRQTDTTFRYHYVSSAAPPFLESMRRPNVSRHTSLVPSHPYRPRTPPYLQRYPMSDAPCCTIPHDFRSAPDIPIMRRSTPSIHQNTHTMQENNLTAKRYQNVSTMQKTVSTTRHGFSRQQIFHHGKETYVLTYTNEGSCL